MRILSATLLAAQQAASLTPAVKIEVKNKMTGVTRLNWERLYQGSEDEYYHGMTAAGDGSLVRTRITLPADGRKLYRQRTVNPGSQSDFSTWTYANQYNCLAVAPAACGSEVSIFWINSNRELRRLKSTNYGASWLTPELLDYTPSTDVHGLAAVYKPNGDLAVFFTDQMSVWVKKCAGGNWQTTSGWDKITGYLSSVSTVYDGDWNLMLTGQDANGNYKVWSLIYGDGGNVPAGVWSSLQELAAAPAGGNFEYVSVFLDKPDVYRAGYVEKFSGVQSYNRPFFSYSIPETGFSDNLWCEPSPFNLACEYGLAMAHAGSYGWLSTANGVWRTSLAETSLDITADVLEVKYETLPEEGRLLVTLRNDDGKYQSPGAGSLSILNTGSQLEFNPGYVTAMGNETSSGPVFWLDSWEHGSSGGKSSLMLYGIDGWYLLKNWRAGHQFRWNKDSNEMSVKQILAFVLGRVGLRLEAQSESAVVTGFYPDFTIHPDDRGDLIVQRLLSFIPDTIFIEGLRVFLVNPQSTDSPVYAYGQAHLISQGKYHSGSWQTNQVRIEGLDPGSGEPIITDVFSWEQMAFFHDRTKQITDRNIGSVAAGQSLAGAYLRKAEIESTSGLISTPVNCGQQLYDVIEITDLRAGLCAAKKRVMGITVSYLPERGEYEQKLLLGGV
jgi:hypothetical protein